MGTGTAWPWETPWSKVEIDDDHPGGDQFLVHRPDGSVEEHFYRPGSDMYEALRAFAVHCGARGVAQA